MTTSTRLHHFIGKWCKNTLDFRAHFKFPNREQKKTGASSKGKKKHAEVDMGDPEQVLCRTIIIYFKLGNAIYTNRI